MKKQKVQTRLKWKEYRRQKLKKFFKVLFVGAVLIGILGFTYKKGRGFVFESGRFNIKTIEIAGQEDLEPYSIYERTNIKRGDNIFRINKKKSEKSLLVSFPRIKDIDIVRRFPDKIIIKITERKPIAKIEYDLIDEEMVRFSAVEKEEILPIIFGNSVKESVDFLVKVKDSQLDLYNNISKVTTDVGDLSVEDLTEGYGVVFFLKDGVKVKFGTISDFELKIIYLKAMIDNLKKKNVLTDYIDMTGFDRENKNIFVKEKTNKPNDSK